MTYLHPRNWLYWLYICFIRLTCLLPLPVIHGVGSGLGWLLYIIVGKRKSIAMRNLQLCFPELTLAQRKELTRRNFISLGKGVFDIGLGAWASENRLDKLVNIENIHYLERALAENRSVILLVPHYINIGLGFMYLSSKYPMLAMYKKPRNKFIHSIYTQIATGDNQDLWFNKWLFSHNRRAELIEHRQGLKKVITCLKNKQLFYYLPDQNLGTRHTVFAPFFGIQTSTVSAIRRLSLISNSVVIPCSSLQCSKGIGYTIRFDQPLPPAGGNDVAYVTLMNKAIENSVCQYPEQYFWLHRRFATRPMGEPDLYENL